MVTMIARYYACTYARPFTGPRPAQYGYIMMNGLSILTALSSSLQSNPSITPL